MIRVKLCGMTRAVDAAAAAEHGAEYVGVIFAGGPRHLTTAAAVEVLEPVRGLVGTIGVFGRGDPAAIAEAARAAGLDGVQLHADPTAEDVQAVRRRFDGTIWAAHRVQDGIVPDEAIALFEAADGVVLDARVEGALGGTGATLPWAALGDALHPMRGRRAALVLAGGLRPENLGEAVQAIAPDIVDVSSGIESAPGVKDHERMRAFLDAARTAAMPRSM